MCSTFLRSSPPGMELGARDVTFPCHIALLSMAGTLQDQTVWNRGTAGLRRKPLPWNLTSQPSWKIANIHSEFVCVGTHACVCCPLLHCEPSLCQYVCDLVLRVMLYLTDIVNTRRYCDMTHTRTTAFDNNFDRCFNVFTDVQYSRIRTVFFGTS